MQVRRVEERLLAWVFAHQVLLLAVFPWPLCPEVRCGTTMGG